ncbi:cisplatin damage response ATP-dependent DNA ligase [Monaibacterium marinum]|nr:cisplatin damage response ATP-dependent DNA ligase [Monaibacterium marinum]
MTPFANLVEQLSFMPDDQDRQTLLRRYFANASDQDRGWALAVLAGTLQLPRVKPALLNGLIEAQVDPVLLDLSRAHVGDQAETIALLWPEPQDTTPPALHEVVTALSRSSRSDQAAIVTRLLNRCDATARLVFIRLCLGRLAVSVSPATLRAALSDAAHPVEGIARLWHQMAPPYAALFTWLDGGAWPKTTPYASYKPAMRVEPLTDALSPTDYEAEWQWDGIRVQVTVNATNRRLYTAAGDDISNQFPEIIDAMHWHGTVEAMLLVQTGDDTPSHEELRRRLRAKTPPKKPATTAILRPYDLLEQDGEDLRDLPWHARRDRLLAIVGSQASPLLPFTTWAQLGTLRNKPAKGACGVMLKRRDAPYGPTETWHSWLADPKLAHCVLLSAQRGQGRQAAYYTEFTYGVWDGAQRLIPLGTAQFGGSPSEALALDAYMRDNAVGRFGPVRTVQPELVLQISYASVQHSTRHKSGITLRRASIQRIKWHEPMTEAARLSDLRAQI